MAFRFWATRFTVARALRGSSCTRRRLRSPTPPRARPSPSAPRRTSRPTRASTCGTRSASHRWGEPPSSPISSTARRAQGASRAATRPAKKLDALTPPPSANGVRRSLTLPVKRRTPPPSASFMARRMAGPVGRSNSLAASSSHNPRPLSPPHKPPSSPRALPSSVCAGPITSTSTAMCATPRPHRHRPNSSLASLLRSASPCARTAFSLNSASPRATATAYSSTSAITAAAYSRATSRRSSPSPFTHHLSPSSIASPTPAPSPSLRPRRGLALRAWTSRRSIWNGVGGTSR